ncbi:NADP-dependent glyceraldehyde-3-phosphate dehydrogenase [Burkholderia sp. AU42008]|uniref:NADP-dependent glyceraldehyde-3-phosphate dehydrogenase n=1 Tax=unclassified Burkholderia TaxID=2613784 RepID=UPI000B7A2668|nr:MULTISPECIES: NADP-dependent glyceraldehyde-3-phosphate dehydrogenase [unclassified Burkholderia]MBR8235301.1 NADP-dependent glyceraldehyde-3-phosphate dehydrogenase [Burkholderia sp. AU32357]MBY4873799.1 NADP-dependent glyceraldehyde-3-phosphate dehydrogenase [Burkholderia sp. AU42008]OXI39952.1 NADP-dependent glyceraldehyde-3-phosphate dehydrogenase [Burkholderia sp. AU17457]
MPDSASLQHLFPALQDIPAEFRLASPIHQRVSLVDGELRPWDGATKTVLSPVCVRQADGSVEQVEIGSYPVMGETESDAALDAAVRAYDAGRGEWPTMKVEQRIACMQDFIKRMVAQRELVVNLIMWEIGKSLADSQKEFDRTVTYMTQTIDALKELDNANSRFVIAEGTIGQIRRTPLGVVLCMGPYNYPLNETFATLIPALLMGNTVVFKPPQYGTLLFKPLLEAFRDAFPKGVINTIYAPGAVVVPHMLASGKINVLALIGSSKVADHLKKQHPKSHRLRAILGLDAKNAAIVLPDADLDLTVKECLLGALSFNGQRCTALKMLLVHRSIVDEFLKRFTAALEQLKIGMPWEKGVSITPLPGMHRTAYMTDAIDDARALGAHVVNQSGGEFSKTLFYPAVVYPVSEGMKLYREEQFGPIIPVAPFDDVDTALDYVTTSEHGQQVSIFGSDPAQIGALVDPLVNQVCRVNINCQCQRGPDVFPFAGRKDSAEGTLSVSDALRAFSIRSMVAAKQTDSSKQLLDSIVSDHHSKFINTGFIF